MKITIFLFFTGLISLIADPSYSQNTKISLNMKNAPIESVLNEIEEISEFYFLYNHKLIDVERKVDLTATEKPIKEILSEIFTKDVSFIVSDRQIVLTPTQGSNEIEKLYQQQTVTGKVTDASTGEVMPGVNIQIKGTTLGTITDAQGNFTLFVPERNAILIFSFIGYIQQEIPLTGYTTVNVALASELTSLKEVVVVGYGTQKRVNLTGSVDQITSEKLEKRPLPTINQALQGVTPGLIIQNTVYGGEPGARMSLNIRGIGSLTAGASPYVLVDGSPVDINTVNPNDVESISILKDAASTAIYGARATYGVILITTKTGKLNEKMTTSYSNSLSWGQPTYMPKAINSLTFANLMNIAAANSGQSQLFSDATIERIKKYQEDPENFPALIPDPNTNYWGTWNLTNGNTDWYDVIFKDWSFSQKHDLGVSGGSKNASYYVGLGWLDQGGKLNFVNDYYERYNLNSNIEINITEGIKLAIKSKFSRSTTKYPISSESITDRTILFGMFSRSWPTYPVYTPNGDLMMDVNQAPALAKGGSDKVYSSDLWLNPSLDIKITKDWHVNANFSYNASWDRRSYFRAIIQGFQVDGVTPMLHYSQNFNRIQQSSSNNEYLTSNIFTNFEKLINGHFFNILLLSQAELSNKYFIEGWKRDLISESVPSISTATGDKDIDDVISHWSTLGSFMRISYNFNEKYLLELNGRYDGSSRFDRERRWGFFPSASLGYNIWKENFWEPIKNVINILKLRASYGSLGNQNVAN